MPDMPSAPGAEIHPSQLDARQPVPAGYALLDVREQHEWDAGHAPDALHIPMSELPDRVADLPDEELLVVCRSGGRSSRVVAWLNHSGFDSYNVADGMKGWRQAGLPLVTDDGTAPTVI